MPQIPMLCPSMRFTLVDLANFERQRSRLGNTGRCRKLPTLGGTSRIFLLEASSPSQEGGHVFNLLQQIWDSLEFSSFSPQTHAFLCNSFVSAITGTPGDNPCGCFVPDFHQCPISQLCLAGRPNQACTPHGPRSLHYSQKLLQGSMSTITCPTALRTHLDLL